MASQASVFGSLRNLGRRFWLTFLLACALAEGGEFLFEHLLASGENPPFHQFLFTMAGAYQRLLSAPRAPIVRFTSIVEIDPAVDFPDVSATNPCAEREFLARLLDRIQSAGPALIVIDKYFGAYTCPPGHPATRALAETIARIRQSRSLIVGRRTRETRTARDEEKVFVENAVQFGGLPEFSLDGIVNIAADNRRLPLQWQIHPEPGSGPDVLIVKDTLALAAAQAFDKQLLQQRPLLARLLENGEQPFIGFLRKDQFQPFHSYASEILCGKRTTEAGAWQKCDGGPVPRGALQNRIVLVGENDPDRDEHESVIGKVPGFYLHANYIEALLDDRYFRSGGKLLDYGFGFVFLIALELILVVHHREVWKAIAIISLLTLAGYFLLYLILMHLGTYIDPVPVGASAVLIKVLHLLYGRAHEARSPAADTKAESK